ncbi:glutamyl-tRNA reductase [Corynebacterium sp. CCM 8864]|uniref:Glutamyl-tRNA reductase n=1 Tax=Corynebacterium marambiense TaxID=2765364 RepID=A0ABS0VS06_9CORY|nr:glutamyl-tRNA reductase [Corynebacterium marambiense]MBI8999558.1 glutamyl-tRNA reductase [Corynebacterium marambiense]MCX7541681.1 glutamyl-tRNA reductase [Corynebacterium marambiense]
MSVLVVGMSHRSAPVAVLEQVSMNDDVAREQASRALIRRSSLSEAMIVSTCNRVEIYCVTNSFHTGVNDVVEVLHAISGVDTALLRRSLYVRYADAAAEHMLVVTSGLDSMVIGEQQIIGQVRAAYSQARELGTAGPTLHALAQCALHTGKRVHTETDIDDAGASMVSFACSEALRQLGSDGRDRPFSGTTAMVLGAGVMASLAATHLGRMGVDGLVLTNRTRSRAEILAEHSREAGVPARVVDFDERAAALSEVDIVISATGADNFTVTADDVPAGCSLTFIDLSLPRDIDDAVADLPGVRLVNIERLHEARRDTDDDSQAQAMRIVSEELDSYSSAQRIRDVVPAVAALRRHASDLVEAEMERLAQRTPTMSVSDREEVSRTVRRVVDKLLHQPTVRVKELAAHSGTVSYESALQELFGLTPPQPARPVAVAAVDLPVGDTEMITSIRATVADTVAGS